MPDRVIAARMRLARLYANGKTPDPEHEAEVRLAYVCAKLEDDISTALRGQAPLSEAQRARLVRAVREAGGASC